MDNKEAIWRILDHQRIHSKKEPFTPKLDEAFAMAIEALKEQRPHGEWIPCSERLPSDEIHVDGMVLVCYENGSIRFNSFMDGQWVQGNPIAWMPLPEPYRGEKEVKAPPLPVKETEGTLHWLIWAATGLWCLWWLIVLFFVLPTIL